MRDRNSAFHLEVFGGNRLWGEREDSPAPAEGITYHGLTGQRKLAKALLESSFSLQLQGGTESCPLSAFEALRAGCIVLASEVGAYPELIKSGVNGFLLTGHHRSMEVRRQATDLVLSLVNNPMATQELRRKAMAVPRDTRRAALTWVRHWDLVLRQGPADARSDSTECERCGGRTEAFPDGNHCMLCGHYLPVAPSTRAEIPFPGQNHGQADRRH